MQCSHRLTDVKTLNACHRKIRVRGLHTASVQMHRRPFIVGSTHLPSCTNIGAALAPHLGSNSTQCHDRSSASLLGGGPQTNSSAGGGRTTPLGSCCCSWGGQHPPLRKPLMSYNTDLGQRFAPRGGSWAQSSQTN